MSANATQPHATKPTPVLVECASCKQPGFLDTWPYLSSADHSEAYALLLQGKLFKYTCPACGTTTTMAYDCLLYDTKHAGVLLYSPSWDNDEACCKRLVDVVQHIAERTDQRIQARVVHSTFEFCEKARLWNEGYDDRIIELMKVAIKRGMLEEGIVGPRDILIYERTLDDGGVSFIVSGEIPGDTVGVPQGYTYLKEQWEQVLDTLEGEYHFDAAWANSFLP